MNWKGTRDFFQATAKRVLTEGNGTCKEGIQNGILYEYLALRCLWVQQLALLLMHRMILSCIATYCR